MLSCFYSHLLSTGRPISSLNIVTKILLTTINQFETTDLSCFLVSFTGSTAANIEQKHFFHQTDSLVKMSGHKINVHVV